MSENDEHNFTLSEVEWDDLRGVLEAEPKIIPELLALVERARLQIAATEALDAMPRPTGFMTIEEVAKEFGIDLDVLDEDDKKEFDDEPEEFTDLHLNYEEDK